jgi:hypothetical protein
MSTAEFERRWRAANHWMAVVVPKPALSGVDIDGTRRGPAGTAPQDLASDATSSCAVVVAEGVRLAQADDLQGAERTLSAAIGCPAAMRELAGVRVLQKRWAEATDLATAALEADRADEYAWKILATSRFVQNDRLGALAAWNAVGEPRIDLVRLDGLTRTRYRPVEQLMRMPAGELLSADRFIRAQRRLAELPSATSTRLEYTPVPAGLAELHAVVSERPVAPSGPLSLAAIGLSAAVSRELRITTGSVFGGGERINVVWRFWPRRPRLAATIEAPAPWGGLWSAEAYSERQPFDAPQVPRAERTGARLRVSDWATARWRWTLAGGVDEWSGSGARGAAGASLHFASVDGRIDSSVDANLWSGGSSYATTHINLRAQSSTDRQGLVYSVLVGVETASPMTPMNLWPAGDTGHVHGTLLRAHPVLSEGRLRVERLGRAFAHGSIEARRWWRITGPVRAAAAAFTDIGRTAWRADDEPRTDVDVGVGGRFVVAGIPGVFRADLARGLRDATTAISLLYEP